MSVLYRVAQEAVLNARRHAAPTRIELRFCRDPETASIEIVDDGRGFDPKASQGDRAGIGLFTMRERVALVDGELQIRSQPGGGTSVLATVPLHAAPNSFLSGRHA
jgi:two-component system NarL family sensor kinase